MWSKDCNAELFDVLDEYFYTCIGSETPTGDIPIYFSRLPELPEMAKSMSTASIGVLFGFPTKEVASYVESVDPDGQVSRSEDLTEG